MKVDQLKNIIKEAVREAVREEVKDILVEALTKSPKQPVNTVQENKKQLQDMFSSTDDPMMRMLAMTKKSMTQDDYKNVTGVNEQVIGRSQITQEFNSNLTGPSPTPSFTGPQPGLNLNSLDFVKNAAAIYNKSVEKDKFRVGM